MDKFSLISVIILLFLIIVFKYKCRRKNLIKDNIYIQTFFIIVATISLIRETLFFRHNIINYISLGVLFIGFGTIIPRYIKKLKKKG